ncbi:ABC transporter ATP-binding protein [Halobium salinum]|uniref:Molybdate/tungstate import ATP-binding protein WtpC n=1 Tax=Halobium salinum TaxID=1364940 RepID=A0ABD5PAY2_9EURY|nr:ABC transporter ATP-binding protein [Halobium salinum]
MSLHAEIRARFTAPGAEPFVVDAALDADAGETLVVLGPSGSGKTLLLEAVAGFHSCEGRVAVDGRDVSDLPPEARNFGFVFQDYALFPHMTVAENVRFGERYLDDGAEVDARSLLDSLGVADLADRYPPTLSGGERQRVALARSLAVAPDAFLLDEPLSALDAPTRAALRGDLADTLADRTAVYVTHDRTTARALADRVAVMHDGQVVQHGTPDDVFERPASPFVARFTGSNVVAFDAADAGRGSDPVAIRPEHVALVAPGRGDVEGVVERAVREDAAFRVTVALDGPVGAVADGSGRDGDALAADRTLDAFAVDPPAPGDRVGVALPEERLARFDE